MPPMKPPGRAPALVARRRDEAITTLRRHGASIITLAAATGLTLARVEAIVGSRTPEQMQAEHEALKHGQPQPG